MWVRKASAGHPIYLWEHTEQGLTRVDSNLAVLRAALNPPHSESTYSLSCWTGQVAFALVPAKLVTKLEALDMNYTLVLGMHDSGTIARLAGEAKREASDELSCIGRLVSGLQQRGDDDEGSRRSALENKEAFYKRVPGEIERMVASYERAGYLEVSCQRGWRGTGNRREIEPGVALSDQERSLLRPAVQFLAQQIYTLDPPFRSPHEYKAVLEHF